MRRSVTCDNIVSASFVNYIIFKPPHFLYNNRVMYYFNLKNNAFNPFISAFKINI